MSHFDIIRQHTPKETFRVASVRGTYDLQDKSIVEHFVGDIDLPNDWQIGLIVGASGTGKTTIAKELFPEAYFSGYEYIADTLLDDMPKSASVSQIEKTLSSVGLSSVPSWLKPYNVLSNGEKMRCDLARAILDDKPLVVFDEFTSVVDRQVAKVGSFAMQKAIRKTDKKFIAVGCHYDIEDWLLPDWVFYTDTMTFRVNDGKQKKNRPTCRLDIYETKAKEHYWRMFGKYHYLNHSFNKVSRVFVATLDGQPCAFSAILPFPHPMKKNFWKEHRTVVLPDYQGIGISMHLTHFICELLTKEHKGWITTTSNPARIAGLAKDKRFRCTRIGRASSGSGCGKIQNKNKKGSTSCNRITASFEYINTKKL